MRSSVAALVLAAITSAAALTPATTAASSCSSSYDGVFEIQIINATSSTKRSLSKRGALELTLADGVLKDAKGRIGYIASNNQFQFDNPVQTGTIFDAGWAVCSNGTLVLGPDAVFQECLSGTFYNLYDENTAAQCTAVYIDVISTGTTTSVDASQISDGQIQATSAAAPVSQISDGQIQEPTTTAAVVSQITDGQIQAPTTTAVPVGQISDGQIQASVSTTYSAVSQFTATTNGTATAYTSAPLTPSLISSATIPSYTGAAAFPSARGELFGLAAGVLAVAML